MLKQLNSSFQRSVLQDCQNQVYEFSKQKPMLKVDKWVKNDQLVRPYTGSQRVKRAGNRAATVMGGWGSRSRARGFFVPKIERRLADSDRRTELAS